MKKIALALALLFGVSTGFNAVAADANSPANGAKTGDVKKPAPEDEMPHIIWPPPPSALGAASGSMSGTTIAYIVAGVVVIAAVASHKGSTGTH